MEFGIEAEGRRFWSLALKQREGGFGVWDRQGGIFFELGTGRKEGMFLEFGIDRERGMVLELGTEGEGRMFLGFGMREGCLAV